ncbi:MAG: hypothetical protein ACI841_001163 [Planctomycetota bacterium]|jgi:hypothetical protein
MMNCQAWLLMLAVYSKRVPLEMSEQEMPASD